MKLSIFLMHNFQLHCHTIPNRFRQNTLRILIVCLCAVCVLLILLLIEIFGIYLRDCTKSAFDNIQLLVGFFRFERAIAAAFEPQRVVIVLVVC